MKQMRGALTVLICLGLMVVPTSAAARSSGDHLVTGFGNGGAALVSANISPDENPAASTRLFSATTPGGGTVIAMEGRTANKFVVFGFTAAGRPQPGFGKGGKVEFGLSGNGEFLHLDGVTVDPTGRVLIADEGRAPSIVALTPNGALETSFGTNGVAVFEPEIPPQKGEEGGAGFTPTGIAVDSAGRIVLSGDATRDEGTCKTPKGRESESDTAEGAVVRLTAAGTIDASFGTNGYYLTTNKALVGADGIAVGPGNTYTTWGEPLICGDHKQQPKVIRLTESGTPDPSFAKAGVFVGPRVLSGGRAFFGNTHVFVTSAGDTVWVAASGDVGRLLPNGTPDPSFGKHGIAKLPIGKVPSPDFEYVVKGIAVAADGSVLVTGTHTAYPSGSEYPQAAAFLGSLTAEGKPRPGFGKGGVVTLPFAPKPETAGAAVIALGDHGAFVVGAAYGWKGAPKRAVGLFRFDLG